MPISSRGVLLAFLLMVFAGPVLLGPVFYAIAQPWGVPFHRAMNRALMVSALGALFVFRHRLKLRTWWPPGMAGRQLGMGLALAMVSALSMIVLYGVCRGFEFAQLSFQRASLSVLLALIAARIVPMFEETIFRGFLVTTLVEATGRRLGWVLSAVLFALAHFLKIPSDWNGREIHAWSGLTGMASAFANLGHAEFLSGRGVNLFLVGLILSGIFLQVRTLWIGAGLHGGWILVLMSFTALTRPLASPRFPQLGGDLLGSPVTSVVLILLGLALWRGLPRTE